MKHAEGYRILIKNYQYDAAEGTTPELDEICSPIKLEGRVIGVIGLVAFTVEQKKQLMSNTEAALLFLDHMADLLAAKVSESKTMERLTLLSGELSTILETIHEGALAINAQGLVTHCNTTDTKLLNCDRSAILGKTLADFWDNAPAFAGKTAARSAEQRSGEGWGIKKNPC